MLCTTLVTSHLSRNIHHETLPLQHFSHHSTLWQNTTRNTHQHLSDVCNLTLVITQHALHNTSHTASVKQLLPQSLLRNACRTNSYYATYASQDQSHNICHATLGTMFLSRSAYQITFFMKQVKKRESGNSSHITLTTELLSCNAHHAVIVTQCSLRNTQISVV